jgi:predicted acyl esterase
MVTGRHDLPFYSDEEVEIQKSFLSAFLKDDDYAGWTKGQQPQVSLVLRRSGIEINNPKAAKAFDQRNEMEWPIARTAYTKFYLTPDLQFNQTLPNVSTTRLSYPALSTIEDPRTLSFTTDAFDTQVEITGHIVASLNISATPHLVGSVPRDIDVFLTLRHLQSTGEEVFYTGTIGDPVPLCKGWLRASLRKVNETHTRNLPYLPYRDYFSTDVTPVIPGEVYNVDIEMWPTSVVLQPGEKLLFEVSSGDTQGAGIFVHDGEER